MALIRRFDREVDDATLKTQPVDIVAFDAGSGTYTVNYRGAEVSGVISTNNVRHTVGHTVQAIIDQGLIKSLIP